MTKEEAKKLIDSALAQVQTSRQNHALLMEALKVLSSEEKREDIKKEGK